MPTISKLSPGQTVYSVERRRMGNTTISRGACFSVYVIEVHPSVNGSVPFVIASWNSNPSRKFYEKSFKKWKLVKPEPKGSVLGMKDY